LLFPLARARGINSEKSDGFYPKLPSLMLLQHISTSAGVQSVALIQAYAYELKIGALRVSASKAQPDSLTAKNKSDKYGM
jgi:hypothetical protein